jgi:hypothetical protein
MHRTMRRLPAAVLVALGMLGINVASAPAQEQLTATVTVDSGTVDPETGIATISGTVTCSEPVFVEVSGELSQSSVNGFGAAPVECPGSQGTSYSFTVEPVSGVFRGGPARLNGGFFACHQDPATGDCSGEIFAQPIDVTVTLQEPTKPAETPAPVPTDVPAGTNAGDSHSLGLWGVFAASSAAVAGATMFARRRFLNDS